MYLRYSEWKCLILNVCVQLTGVWLLQVTSAVVQFGLWPAGVAVVRGFLSLVQEAPPQSGHKPLTWTYFTHLTTFSSPLKKKHFQKSLKQVHFYSNNDFACWYLPCWEFTRLCEIKLHNLPLNSYEGGSKETLL